MSAFSLTPRIPVVEPAGDFPTGIQVQENEVNVGPPNPENISFDNDFVLTYDSATGTVHVESSGSGSGGGGGGGFTPTVFSYSLSADQSSGSRLLADITSARGQTYAGYAAGAATIQAGDGGMWMFGAEVGLNANLEVTGDTRQASITVNGGSVGDSDIYTLNGNDQRTVIVASGPVRLSDGDVVACDFNQAFSSGSSGVQAVGSAATRFWGVRIGD